MSATFSIFTVIWELNCEKLFTFNAHSLTISNKSWNLLKIILNYMYFVFLFLNKQNILSFIKDPYDWIYWELTKALIIDTTFHKSSKHIVPNNVNKKFRHQRQSLIMNLEYGIKARRTNGTGCGTPPITADFPTTLITWQFLWNKHTFVTWQPKGMVASWSVFFVGFE